MYMKKAMIDVAFDVISDKNKALTFIELWKEICQTIGFSKEQEEDNIAQFYSDLSLDDRFTCVGENKWDLRERHTYQEVVVDTSEILIEEDGEENAEFEDEEESSKENSEDF